MDRGICFNGTGDSYDHAITQKMDHHPDRPGGGRAAPRDRRILPRTVPALRERVHDRHPPDDDIGPAAGTGREQAHSFRPVSRSCGLRVRLFRGGFAVLRTPVLWQHI